MPLAAIGREICRMTSQRVAPRARGAFLKGHRGRLERGAGQRRDGGQDHDGQDKGGGQKAGAGGRRGEEGNPAQMRVEPVAQRRRDRDDDVDAPQAVDDAGNGGEEFHQEFEDVPHFQGQIILRQEDGDGHTQRRGDQQGQHRADQRAVDQRKRAVAVIDRVPLRSDDETEPILPDRRKRRIADLQRNPGQQRDRPPTRDEGGPGENDIKDF